MLVVMVHVVLVGYSSDSIHSGRSRLIVASSSSSCGYHIAR